MNAARWLSPHVRSIVARIFLFIGSFGPGILLALDEKVWGASPTLKQMSQLPIPLWVYGVVLVIAALALLVSKWRDTAYTAIAVFYLIANISAVYALLHGNINSALIFTLPVMLWLYLEAAITASRDEAGINEVLHKAEVEKIIVKEV